MTCRRIPYLYTLSVALLISSGLAVLTWVSSAPQGPSLWPNEPPFTIATVNPLLVFEPYESQAGAAFDFVSRGHGYSVLLGPDRMVMNVRGGKRGAYRSVEMKVVGGNAQAEAQALGPLESKTNYLIGNDRSQWRTDVPNFGRVKFSEVYPGIDLVYYDSRKGRQPTHGKRLEYDFVVSPGVDPAVIRLGFDGVEELSVGPEGDLLLETPAGQLRHHKPFVYQQIAGVTKRVGGRYVLSQESLVSFELGAYDPSHALIIDPTIDDSGFFGGDDFDMGASIAIDAQGNTYIIGSTSGSYPTTPGAFDFTLDGPSDCFVTKLNSDGSAPVYSTVIGGNGEKEGAGIAVDSNGNAYTTGFSNSPNYPQFPPVPPPPPAGFNSFLTVVNPDGTDLLFSGITGGSGGEDGLAIDLVELDLVSEPPLIVVGTTGQTFSTDFPVTSDALMGEHGGGFFDAFGEISAFERDPETGALTLRGRSVTYLGGDGEDSGNAIQIVDTELINDSLRVRSLAGLTTSTPDLPTSGQEHVAGLDAYIAYYQTELRLNETVGAPWFVIPEDSRYIAGSGNDRLEHIALSADGDAFGVLTSTSSTDLTTSPDAVFSNNPGGVETMSPRVFRLTPGFRFLDPAPKGDGDDSEGEWSTYLGTSGTDTGKAIAFDRNGCVVVVGSTTSPNYPVTDAAPQTEYGGGPTDAVVTRICDNGTRIDMSTYLGGPGADVANGVVIGPLDQIVVAGTAGAGFPTTPGSAQPDFGGGAGDAFVTSIQQTFVANAGLVSSAKFSQGEGGGISPQEILSEFGAFVGPEAAVGLMFDQAGNVLREIGGTSVLVNGGAVPMVSASQFQTSFIAPGDLLFGKGVGENSATVQFVVDGDPSNTITIPVVPANPGIYTPDFSVTGQGAILNPDFSVNGPGNPAPSDSFISVFGTGGGAVDPPCPDGEVGPSAEPLPRLQLPNRALVDGEEAQVLFAGSAPQLVCGANQYVVAPAGNPTGPAVTVQICVADACSNVVTAAFE